MPFHHAVSTYLGLLIALELIQAPLLIRHACLGRFDELELYSVPLPGLRREQPRQLPPPPQLSDQRTQQPSTLKKGK